MSVSHFRFHPHTFTSTFPSPSPLTSPLSPRSLNVPPSKLFYMDSTSASKPLVSPPLTPINPPNQPNENSTIFQQAASLRPSALLTPRERPSANPLIKTEEQSRKDRRKEYLNRVQQRRDEDRWHVRGEQILHLDYITQERAWEAQQAEAAPALEPEWDDDGEIEPDIHTHTHTQPGASSLSGIHRSSQYPWFKPSSPKSQTMHIATSQQSAPSQPSQQHYRQFLQSNSRGENQLINPAASALQDEEEIDAILEAEQRELEALVASHEAESAMESERHGITRDEMCDQLPEIIYSEHMTGAGGGMGDIPSSPAWGSEDSEFEAELLRLGGDHMDISGG